MSSETLQWLNTKTLIGYTGKRGNAWHYRAEDQDGEGNHYVGAVPVEDVRRRLFGWQAVEGTVRADVLMPDGVLTVQDMARKAIVRPPGALSVDDPGAILGLFKSGYQIHQFDEWLIDSVSALLDDDLQIGSAGLLKAGAVAWVSIEMPDSIVTPSGVEFRPNLLACTSHDGSLATTFQRVVTNVVCDNTMSAALREGSDQRVKVKHSRYSGLKLHSAREALAMVHTIGEQFSAQVEELTNTAVSEGDWNRFVDSLAPIPEAEGRGRTLAEGKRGELNRLWNHDSRVLPWKGTAFGVVQAVNTYVHHSAKVRGGSLAERNMQRAADGGVDKLDAGTLATLDRVLARV